MLKLLVQGAGINFLGYASIMILNLTFQLLLARMLNSEEFGTFALAFSITNIALLFGCFGIEGGMVKYIALYTGNNDKARLVGTIVSGGLIVGVSCLVTMVFFLGFTSMLVDRIYSAPNLKSILYIMTASVPFGVFTIFFLSVTQGFKRMEYRVVIEKVAVPFLKIVGVAAFFAILGRGVIQATYAILIASIIGAVLSFFSVLHLRPNFAHNQRPALIVRDLAGFSCYLMIADVTGRLWQDLPTLFLGSQIDSIQAGVYFLVMKIAGILTVFMTVFSPIFTPIMAGLYGQQDFMQFEKLLKTVTRWGYMFSLPATMMLLIFSEELLRLINPAYVTGSAILRIVIFMQLINVATGPLGWVLVMSGHPRLHLLNSVSSLALSLVLAFFLIPRYGIMGATLTSFLGMVFYTLLCLVEVYKILRIHPFSTSFFKPTAAILLSVTSASCIYLVLPSLKIADRLGISGLVLVISYGVILVVLRLDADDQFVFNALRNRLSSLARVLGTGAEDYK